MNVLQVSAITFAIQSFVTLFVIFDPPGATPIFLGLVADRTPKERRKLAIQAAGVSLLVISIFAIFGQFILDYLHISIASLQAAGGLLLLLVSLELLTGKDSGSTDARDKNIALVPLGTPLLAGPGAIVATMIFVSFLTISSYLSFLFFDKEKKKNFFSLYILVKQIIDFPVGSTFATSCNFNGTIP